VTTAKLAREPVRRHPWIKLEVIADNGHAAADVVGWSRRIDSDQGRF